MCTKKREVNYLLEILEPVSGEEIFLFPSNFLIVNLTYLSDMQRIYHPNAWLPDFKNVQPGLERRTEILRILEKKMVTAKDLSETIDVTYSTILYHLHNLESKKIITSTTSKPPYQWKVRPVGQQILNRYHQ